MTIPVLRRLYSGTISVLVVMALSSTHALFADNTITKEQIVTALDARDEMFGTFKLKCTYNDYMLDANPSVVSGESRAGMAQELRMEWGRKGDKERFIKERQVGEQRSVSEWAYNGSEVRQIDHSKYTASISGRRMPQDMNIKPYHFFMADSGYRWGDLARNGEIIGMRGSSAGRIYQMRIPEPDNNWYYIVDLLESSDFSPIRVEEYAGGDLMTVREFDQLNKTSEGVWYPQKATCWRFGASQKLKAFDQSKAGNRDEYSFTEVSVADVPDSYFELDIPKGMPIYYVDLGFLSPDGEQFTSEAFKNFTGDLRHYSLPPAQTTPAAGNNTPVPGSNVPGPLAKKSEPAVPMSAARTLTVFLTVACVAGLLTYYLIRRRNAR